MHLVWDVVWRFQVWSLTTCKLMTNLVGHTSVLYTVTVSPDGSLCASGGKDGVAMLWDVSEGKHLYSLDASCTINSLCFSPCNYWLCAATDKSVKVSISTRSRKKHTATCMMWRHLPGGSGNEEISFLVLTAAPQRERVRMKQTYLCPSRNLQFRPFVICPLCHFVCFEVRGASCANFSRGVESVRLGLY